MFGTRLALVNGLRDSKASEFMLLESGKRCTRHVNEHSARRSPVASTRFLFLVAKGRDFDKVRTH